MMAFLRQTLLIAIVALAALWGWVQYVPSSAPYLERAGIDRLLRKHQFTIFGVPVLPSPAEVAEKAGPPLQGGGPGPGGPRGPMRVITKLAGAGEVNDVVTAIGDGQALRAVTVMPEDSGRIVEIAAEPGQFVTEGAVLARLDSEAEEIALERARLVREDAADRVERQRRLYESGAASDVQLRDAQLALRTADLEVRQREFDLHRRTVFAPIPGWIGLIRVEVGDQVTTSTPITQLDDRTRILVEFRLPERHVGRLAVGDAVRAEPIARPGRIYSGVVAEMDNQVDQSSRSLRVRAVLDNESDDLRSGMAFTITLDFPGEPYTAIDALAVQWGSSGAFVWAVEDGAAVRIPVRIIQRTADVVLVEGKIAPGTEVITEGVQMLRPGAPVAPVGAGSRGDDASAGEAARAPGDGQPPGARPAPLPAADPSGAEEPGTRQRARDEAGRQGVEGQELEGQGVGPVAAANGKPA
jgi:RND family efflux transporter MFP subunit